MRTLPDKVDLGTLPRNPASLIVSMGHKHWQKVGARCQSVGKPHRAASKTPYASRVGIRVASRVGFSLIEALFAIAVFAIGAVVLTEAYVNNLYTVSRLEVADDPVAEARFVRQEVVLMENLDDVESGGTIETLSYGDAVWEAVVVPWPEDEPLTDLFHVTLSVTLDERETPPGTQPYVFEFTVLRPTWTEATERTTTLGDAQDRVADFKEKYRGF